MHSASRQTWSLSQRFNRFRTVVGMDDSAGHGGLVDVSIEADGEVIWQSKGVTGSQPPVSTGWLDVSAVDQLTLVVDFGDRADVLDRVNWCDPLLLRNDVQADSR